MRHQYKTGEEVRLGDQIRYADSAGMVVTVVHRGNDHTTGFMICTDAHSLVFLDKAGEDLEFVKRGYPNI